MRYKVIGKISVSDLVGLCSGALEETVQESTVMLWNKTVGGTLERIEELANILQVCVDVAQRKCLYHFRLHQIFQQPHLVYK